MRTRLPFGGVALSAEPAQSSVRTSAARMAIDILPGSRLMAKPQAPSPASWSPPSLMRDARLCGLAVRPHGYNWASTHFAPPGMLNECLRCVAWRAVFARAIHVCGGGVFLKCATTPDYTFVL